MGIKHTQYVTDDTYNFLGRCALVIDCGSIALFNYISLSLMQ